MFKKNIKFSFSLFFVVCLTLGFSVSLQSVVAAWQAPTSNPVGNNVPVSIYSESLVDQTILGNSSLVMAGATSGLSAALGSFDSIGSTGAITAGGSITAIGTIYAPVFLYTSDRRLKKNIELIDSPLEKIMALNGVSFEWKSNGEKSVGLIAQDVEKVFPELVGTNKEGMKSVGYANLVAPLIESVKAQQIQIEELRKEIEILKENR